MCDDIFDDYDEFDEGDNNDADFEDEGCEVDDLIGDDDDFGQAVNSAGPNHDDCMEGIELDVILAAGFGYEMGYGERRRRQRRDTDEF